MHQTAALDPPRSLRIRLCMTHGARQAEVACSLPLAKGQPVQVNLDVREVEATREPALPTTQRAAMVGDRPEFSVDTEEHATSEVYQRWKKLFPGLVRRCMCSSLPRKRSTVRGLACVIHCAKQTGSIPRERGTSTKGDSGRKRPRLMVVVLLMRWDGAPVVHMWPHQPSPTGISDKHSARRKGALKQKNESPKH